MGRLIASCQPPAELVTGLQYQVARVVWTSVTMVLPLPLCSYYRLGGAVNKDPVLYEGLVLTLVLLAALWGAAGVLDARAVEYTLLGLQTA